MSGHGGIPVCIHGRHVSALHPEPCPDCEELAALRELETASRLLLTMREGGATMRAEMREALIQLDDIRRRKGIGAMGHPETRCTCNSTVMGVLDCPEHGPAGIKPIGLDKGGRLFAYEPAREPLDTEPDDGPDDGPVSDGLHQ